ncbi:MFS transporter [Brevibacterium sp. 50QC2O2]|jgi:MHS family alpha-ketoglutarate permease-like MFS transporter|uniref:MFS transporter n=1 Tax=Brevibacterium sp. 50QC2O2 TaxID=2968459 RepID=UPI00211BF193|nr:MFS transporter [Brevibacterium sp. 50QC2O2]MCQ9388120.1 MFS transporter [Brevibacterium sp. 50QC2O2]
MTSTTAASTAESQAPVAVVPLDRRKQRKSFVASTIGQLLEWYEWGVYAVFAPQIAAALFHTQNQVSALLSTFGVFAIGFLFRPLGGIVFGRIADRRGRKFVLVTTMLMMAGGSVLIGLVPTYGTIGIAASGLLLLARVVQGFAHGGESAAANSYIAEIAPAGRRGLWGSTVFMTIFGGSFIAFVLGGAITGVLSKPEVAAWGWRIPFLLGAVLALVALYLRAGMIESKDLVENSRVTGKINGLDASHFPAAALRPLPKAVSIVAIFFLVSGVAASNYTWTSYVSTFAVTQRKMEANGAYWALTAALAVGILSLLFWGWASDRWGRKPVLYIFAIGVAVTQYPLMALIDQRPWTLFVTTSIALFFLAAGAGLLTSVMAETFPTAARTAYIGFAYSLATAVFGGTTPYVNQFAVYIGAPWASNAWIVFAELLALWAVWRLPERKGIDLHIVK